MPWQRPIVPVRCQTSIVGAEALHGRVRDGNGWVRLAPATKAISSCEPTKEEDCGFAAFEPATEAVEDSSNGA
jgi:hypothetical protein